MPMQKEDVKAHGVDVRHRHDLTRLSESDLRISDDEADIRGWSVKSREGRDVGTVADLLVNVRDMAVEFMEVALVSDRSHKIILPIREATLDEDDAVIRFHGASRVGLLPLRDVDL